MRGYLLTSLIQFLTPSKQIVGPTAATSTLEDHPDSGDDYYQLYDSNHIEGIVSDW